MRLSYVFVLMATVASNSSYCPTAWRSEAHTGHAGLRSERGHHRSPLEAPGENSFSRCSQLQPRCVLLPPSSLVRNPREHTQPPRVQDNLNPRGSALATSILLTTEADTLTGSRVRTRTSSGALLY